ncbi:bifunctional solanapyrone synthase [Arthroderma uncinatum]|uniref:bifunctional solanapyrone synthase n=1 Tax=Arthroderma uncinatum TaxID=74035 RepID=UPI00144AE8F4|nr:bifunctional solanapyrone synthase [Arthroderma uncinatum]KAF3484372.1 bifunctional solanapyrone synthase [Arthroderma uncinatum]
MTPSMLATALLGLFASVSVAGNITSSPSCCSMLSGLFPDAVYSKHTQSWSFEKDNFWSSTAVLDPACVFVPDSTEKVARTVRLFSQNECKFSIKGGGHSSIPGAANIDDGIMMVMYRMKDTEINFKEGYIRVGAGLLLHEIYAVLDPYKLSAVIGRYGEIGLGLAVGAGISFFSNRDGLAVDNVRNYEVVLADGKVVNANIDKKENEDLYWALKGGNNNFGVVTHFDLNVIETRGSVYGGLIHYPESSLDYVNDLVYDYHTRQAVDGLLTHAMPQWVYNGTTNNTYNLTPVIYNDDVDELPSILQPWLDVPHVSTTLEKRTYSNLSIHLNEGFGAGLVQEQRVFTVYADKQFYREVLFKFRQWLQGYQDIPGFLGAHLNMPITPRQVDQGVLKGGNALGLEGAGDNTLASEYIKAVLTIGPTPDLGVGLSSLLASVD